MTRGVLLRAALAALLTLAIFGCHKGPEPGSVKDEAANAGRTVESFPAAGVDAAGHDYFHDMDGGIAPAPNEIKGRNTWLVWTGGNDRFWDKMTVASVGNFDLLKTLSSHPALKSNRDNRWKYLGLVNEPCFDKVSGPNPERFGLWLDKRRSDGNCGPDPFEDEGKYPGVKIGARGTTLPVGSYYGYASGVVGLRLFPNPDFDENARSKWDADKYYTDPDYYQQQNLVRPYRVGMSCAFCHVGPNPLHPPANPNSPQWGDLSSNVGAQYFWVDRIWSWPAKEDNYIYQLLQTSRPGTLDTSLVSTDYINNPRTMNAVYGLWPRLEMAKRWGEETISGGELNNKQFNDYTKAPELTQFFEPRDTVRTPHVLKDGSDSVGALGALNRVYLNIGLFSEEWLLHFRPLTGGTPITPIKIADAEANSIYWKATEAQTFDMAAFFLKSTAPQHLSDAPGGGKYLTADSNLLTHGKEVFADRCARCHSSKLPAAAPGLDPNGCAGPGYLDCWNKYWQWSKTDDFRQQMRKIVRADDFLKDNYLSADFRVPVTLTRTNACSPLATNAIAGNIWDNFSSQSYKDLPSVGTINIYDPFTGAREDYTLPAGGRGYTRPPSLIGVWSTAPFLQNNSVGKFNWNPSVDSRMDSFQDSIEQLLWPEKRYKDAVLVDKIPGVIDRTTARSYLWVPGGYLPPPLQKLGGPLSRLMPSLFSSGDVRIGPIPKGTPVDLMANLELVSDSQDPAAQLVHEVEVGDLLLDIKLALDSLPANATDDQAREAFAPLTDKLFKLSKCRDFVVNRGHYFGTDGLKAEPDAVDEPGLSDADKRALIEFVKTF